MWNMAKTVLEFIDKRPRIILLMAWPVWTLCLIGLALIIWLGGWPDTPEAVMKRLDLLGLLIIIIGPILGLNQLAQSSSFFGKMALKIGQVFDLEADMDKDEDETTKEKREGQ